MVPSTLDVEPSILDKKIDSNIKGRFPESRGLRASVSSSPLPLPLPLPPFFFFVCAPALTFAQ